MMFIREEVVAGFVPKLPVIPAGQLEATRVTKDANPPEGVTVTVDVPLAPATAVAELAFKAKLGFGAAVTVSAMLVVAVRLPEVPPTASV